MTGFPDIEALVPHRGPALWLDAVLAHDATTTRCRGRVVASHPLAVDGTLPGVGAMEMIAQTTAAHSALCGRAGGRAENGVVAGVSGFTVDIAELAPTADLIVTVTQIEGGDGPMAVFQGSVSDGRAEIARGRITVVRGEAATGGAG